MTLHANSPHWVGLVAMYMSNCGMTRDQAEDQAAKQYGYPYGHPKYTAEQGDSK